MLQKILWSRPIRSPRRSSSRYHGRYHKIKKIKLFLARNPYKTIIVTESGKALDEYRYCTYCHTRETSWWSEGPYGERTLCESCGKKYKQGVISQVFFKPLIVASQTAECRAKSVVCFRG